MESFFDITALLTAGISFSIGLLSLLSFFRKTGKKIDLLFGLLCLSVFTFILLPPIGFILIDIVPYSAEIKLKRIFGFAFIGMLPWFIALYSGVRKRTLLFVLTGSLAICYLAMFFTS